MNQKHGGLSITLFMGSPCRQLLTIACLAVLPLTAQAEEGFAASREAVGADVGGASAFEQPVEAPSVDLLPAMDPTPRTMHRPELGPTVGSGTGSFRQAKTLFRWPGQAPNYSTGGPDAMVTDRPHFSEASSLVGLGRVQVETGYTVVYDGDADGSVRTQSFGEPLVRAGIFAEWFEFRIASTYLTEQVRDPAGGLRSHGFDDLYLGAKLALTEEMGPLPEIAIFPQMRIPTGAAVFSDDRVLPGFNLAYSWNLTDHIELECNSQLNRRVDGVGHDYVEAIQTANLEYELTERLNAFTEWFVFVPCGALAAQTQHYFHGGFWYLPTPNVQFDIHAGVGLSDASDDLAYTGAGFSFRR